MNSKNISLNRISSRYIRRDSIKNISLTFPIAKTRNNKKNIISNDNTEKKNVSQLTSYVTRSQYVKRAKNKEYFNKSSGQILISTINKKENLNHTMFYSGNKIKINQPRTPLVNSPHRKINSISAINFNRRSVQTPLAKSNRDYIKINNLTYYVRCPYCNHSLNQVPKIEKTHFKKYKIEDKENISENLINNIKYKTEKKSGIKSRIIQDKSEFKNFYINEKGVIVFKPNDKPTTHIKIVNSKPDLSKYINELKIYGKKRNISIYEAPPPTKKIFVRPIKI